jgi:two-component system CheB/CheR fusion protein
VVILDIGLPKLDGYQVAQELRRQGGSPPPLLIAVTGYGQEEYRRRSRQAGFDYHLVKPVDPDVLARLIERPATPPSEGRG